MSILETAVKDGEAPRPRLSASVDWEVSRHSARLLDVPAAARRIASLHHCRSDLLIRRALISAGLRARVPMQI